MALIKDTCETARQIMAGELDADLDNIRQAIAARTKSLFRKHATVRLVGTKNPALEGKVGKVLKVNARTVTVGIGEPTHSHGMTFYPDGEYNVPLQMLEAVTD